MPTISHSSSTSSASSSESLPRTSASLDDDDTAPEACPVCYETYDDEEGRNVGVLRCGHMICAVCIPQLDGSCPICRVNGATKKVSILV